MEVQNKFKYKDFTDLRRKKKFIPKFKKPCSMYWIASQMGPCKIFLKIRKTMIWQVL